jgi:LmbE family N-acetylglucosaminyl deacetylase
MPNKQLTRKKASTTYVAVRSKEEQKKKREHKKRQDRWRKALSGLRSPYVIISLTFLLITSLLWSLLGAQLQLGNADQVIEGSLFQNLTTFRGAQFPSAHTFLIKWPLFLVSGLAHNSSFMLAILTVIVSLLTVAGLVYILYRIDKRPRVFGSIVLALSSVLLLIPAQPHTTGILPVNFAMISTRNIEYIVYILGIVLVIRSVKIRSLVFSGATITLTLLFASDKLFESLGIGAAIITAIVYLFFRKRALVLLAIRLFISSIIASILASLLLWVISELKITHIVGGGGGPYAFITTAKELSLGTIFAVLGLLTNIGANPVFDVGIVKSLPSTLINRLLSPELISFGVNLMVFIAGCIAIVKVFALSLVPPRKPRWNAKKKPSAYTQAVALSIFMIASTIVAVGEFIFTNHYYPVDSRYVTIVLFALFISLATYLRSRPLPKWLGSWRMFVVLGVSIIIGCFWTITTHQQQTGGLSSISIRNQKIADVLADHKSDVLVGDYWRVIPISQLDKEKNDVVLPLSSCTTVRNTLTSDAWQVNLKTHSFIYLLSLDKSVTDYPQCTIAQITDTYGHPNASTLIAGTIEHPQELLLYYDAGITKGKPVPKSSTIFPTSPKVVVAPVCTNNDTIMNIVAHQDDDLLFMNPDLFHEITAGDCIRTIYVTAGDSGQNSVYWLGREQGSQAAYDSLAGLPLTTVWTQKTVKLNTDEYVTVVSPQTDKKISLIFMRLADGNLTGNGFKSSGYESLAQLHSGGIPVINSVDGQSSYTSLQLTTALTQLMNLYNPTILHTQAPKDYGTIYHDHSDHITVGKYVTTAFANYTSEATTPISYYVGYPIRQQPANVTGSDLTAKINAFLAYAKYDGGVCQTVAICARTATYNAYLTRQYTTLEY